MDKESKLLRKVGTRNPFKVPDHYFEDFTRELMNRLPEKEVSPTEQELTLWQRVKPWVYMTAMFCGLMLSARVFLGEPREESFPLTEAEAEGIPDEDWREIIQKSMMDDYSLYEYLTEVDTEYYY